ncbi:MAG TPA: substrate-binding domain-containing protein [Terriglobales bacterium]|nr:substrate-binding domain-containing protein [Terriglobales bacterium]
MSKSKVLALSFLIAVLMPVLSCGTGHEAEEKYFLVADNLQVPYWQTAGAGFSQAAKDLKVRADFVGPDTFDPKAQRQAFEKVLTQKPTGILISTADPQLMKADIDKAIAAHIPVITMDSDAPASKRLYFIGTNNYQAGVAGGERLSKELHGKGNVVAFTMPEQVNLQDRLRGYRDALESTPQIKIVRVVDIKGDPRIAFDSATAIIGKERDKVDAFICLEAQGGKEVATVLSNNEIKNKIVMAMDTDPDTLEWVRRGVIAATISQKPYTMAYFGLMMLDHLYHHKLPNLEVDWSKDSFAPIPAFVDTGSSLIDKSNVDAFLEARKSATSGTK